MFSVFVSCFFSTILVDPNSLFSPHYLHHHPWLANKSLQLINTLIAEVQTLFRQELLAPSCKSVFRTWSSRIWCKMVLSDSTYPHEIGNLGRCIFDLNPIAMQFDDARHISSASWATAMPPQSSPMPLIPSLAAQTLSGYCCSSSVGFAIGLHFIYRMRNILTL